MIYLGRVKGGKNQYQCMICGSMQVTYNYTYDYHCGCVVEKKYEIKPTVLYDYSDFSYHEGMPIAKYMIKQLRENPIKMKYSIETKDVHGHQVKVKVYRRV